MCNGRSQDTRQAGFSLLEMMLVILLMAMLSIGVMMVMPKSLTDNENVDWQAQRLQTKLQFATMQALVSGEEYGLVLQATGYQFARYDKTLTLWRALPSDTFAQFIEIPSALHFGYELQGSVWAEINVQEDNAFIDNNSAISLTQQDKVAPLFPQIFIMSNGEVTPFSVTFTETGGKRNAQRSSALAIDMSGTITYTRAMAQ